MLVNTDAIRALGAACLAQADDLSAAAATLKSLPGPDATAAFGPVGAAFLAALADAAVAEARAITALSENLASAHPVSRAVAGAYTETDQHTSRLL
jgi:Excreted virulence factor EspC, type VII ESX diderm